MVRQTWMCVCVLCTVGGEDLPSRNSKPHDNLTKEYSLHICLDKVRVHYTLEYWLYIGLCFHTKTCKEMCGDKVLSFGDLWHICHLTRHCLVAGRYRKPWSQSYNCTG